MESQIFYNQTLLHMPLKAMLNIKIYTLKTGHGDEDRLRSDCQFINIYGYYGLPINLENQVKKVMRTECKTALKAIDSQGVPFLDRILNNEDIKKGRMVGQVIQNLKGFTTMERVTIMVKLVQTFNEVISSKEGNSIYYLTLANLHLGVAANEKNRNDENALKHLNFALSTYYEGIAHFPNDRFLNYHLGLLLSAQGHYYEAVRHLNTAVREAQKHYNFLLAFGQELEQKATSDRLNMVLDLGKNYEIAIMNYKRDLMFAAAAGDRLALVGDPEGTAWDALTAAGKLDQKNEYLYYDAYGYVLTRKASNKSCPDRNNLVEQAIEAIEHALAVARMEGDYRNAKVIKGHLEYAAGLRC